jgi:hypothetical protein
MSPKAVAANRRNGQLSLGATTKRGQSASKLNSLKRGLLAKGVMFQNESDRTEFEAVLDRLENEIKPKGVLQRMLVEEIGVCWWKLQIAQGWGLEEIQNRRRASKSVIAAVIEEAGDTHFPLCQENGSSPATALNWECDQVFVRSSSRENEGVEPEDKVARLEYAAKLSSPLETIWPYETRLKRDLYKAIQTLKSLQREESDG